MVDWRLESVGKGRDAKEDTLLEADRLRSVFGLTTSASFSVDNLRVVAVDLGCCLVAISILQEQRQPQPG
jgi:hypothetical protein